MPYSSERELVRWQLELAIVCAAAGRINDAERALGNGRRQLDRIRTRLAQRDLLELVELELCAAEAVSARL